MQVLVTNCKYAKHPRLQLVRLATTKCNEIFGSLCEFGLIVVMNHIWIIFTSGVEEHSEQTGVHCASQNKT